MVHRRRLLGSALAAGSIYALKHPSLAMAEAFAVNSPLLGPIRAVTITTGDLKAATDAWIKYMDYHVAGRGAIPAALAASWGAPAMAGRAYVALAPASGEQTYLRFVEQAAPLDYDADSTLGWRTTEITVENSDRLFERIKNSPFKIINPPHGIPTYPYLRAMQAQGPSGERLNLTWITERRTDIPQARSFVGRCFIAVLASPDLPGSLRFYHDIFGNETGPIKDVAVVPPVELAVVSLPDACKIEIDQYPHDAKQRLRPKGGLPTGMAIVTFEYQNLNRLRSRFIAPPITAALDPHRGRPVATMRGASGELLELIEP